MPLNIIVLPVLFEGSVRAVVELASFSRFSATHQAFLDSITESVGIVLNTIEASGLTESLLKQSQSQAEELRSQQEELRGSNEDLARQAHFAVEGLLERALTSVRDRVSENGRLSAGRIEIEQHAVHGLAWLATYVEAIKEMAAYAGYSFGGLVRWMVEDASCDR